MSYFSNLGRRIPYEGMRVFNQTPSEYYRLSQPTLDYEKILNRLKQQDLVQPTFTALEFKKIAESVLNTIQLDNNYKNLLNAVHVPFVVSSKQKIADLGADIEARLLPSVQKEFKVMHPDSHFKAVLQGNSELKESIKIATDSKYEQFIEATQRGTVIGWYFPQALQEFDISSQRSQMTSLPNIPEAQLCLSGAIDVCASIVGSPNLLISKDFYTPILCMSAYEHSDPRMVLLLKAYGTHLEFWCMTQMLTGNITQVSEQWAGGISFYKVLNESINNS